MSGNGADNAHNNQFGGGSRGPTGGVNGSTGLGGGGGVSSGGWGWKYNPGTGPAYTVKPNGEVSINITGGWEKAWTPNGGNGGGGNAPSAGPSGTPPPSAFNKDGTYTAVVDGFKYSIKLDAKGKATSIIRTAVRPYTKAENLQVAVAKATNRNPAEMYPNLDFTKGEAERQIIARQMAEKAWTGKPENIRSFDENVDGFKYQVKLNDLGEVQSVVRTAVRSYTKAENLQIAVAKATNKDPVALYPNLDFSKGEQERQQRARQQAIARFMAVPGAAARVQQLKAQQKAAEDARKKADAEKKAAEAAAKKADELARKHAEARASAEMKLRSTSVMVVRGFPAVDAVSLAPVRYSVAGMGSITLDEPMAKQARSVISRMLAEFNRLATLNTTGPIGLALSLLFHTEKAGQGSANVPGRTLDNMFSTILPGDVLSLPNDAVLRASAGKTINLQIRGVMTLRDGAIVAQLVRTQSATAVRVFNAILDTTTGYYGFTIPGEVGFPSRTILISPANAPGAIGPTILTGPVPLPEVVSHTGGPVQIVNNPTTTTFPSPERVGFKDAIIVFPANSGLKPIYAMFNKPYGESSAKGQYSGRNYNPDQAGGPIKNLDWKSATIDRMGIDKVKLHTGRFGDAPDNKVMVDRLEKILRGELIATDIDKRFYTHEIRELERYRALGVPDNMTNDAVWNDAHTATLEDYKINERTQPLYTPQAEEAYENAEMQKLKGGK